MRLKTKFQDEDFDLGEVVEANVYYGGSGRIKVIAEPAKGGMITFYFETLKGMNEMFEDATEEPEEYWYISAYGNLAKTDVMTDLHRGAEEIGNLFDTKEEAEKVVEKLKAFKRLKDKGFRFKNDSLDICCHTINFKVDRQFDMTDETSRDLHLLFRGEE